MMEYITFAIKMIMAMIGGMLAAIAAVAIIMAIFMLGLSAINGTLNIIAGNDDEWTIRLWIREMRN